MLTYFKMQLFIMYQIKNQNEEKTHKCAINIRNYKEIFVQYYTNKFLNQGKLDNSSLN